VRIEDHEQYQEGNGIGRQPCEQNFHLASSRRYREKGWLPDYTEVRWMLKIVWPEGAVLGGDLQKSHPTENTRLIGFVS
jgi:hypothetical protein